MSEYVEVSIKLTREQAEALKVIFPATRIIDPSGQEQEPPTIENILRFCEERNSPVDGTRFYNYYQPRGWMDGRGEKITDWKQKLIEWETNGKSNRKPKQTQMQPGEKKFEHKKEDLDQFYAWYGELCKNDEFAKVEAEKQGYGR